MYFIHRLSKISLVHVNLRIQLCSCALQFSVTCTTRLADYMNVAYEDKPRIVLMFYVIAAERLFATILHNTYERRGNNWAVDSDGHGTCLAIYTSCVIKRDGEQCTYVKLLIQILFMIADSYQMFFMGYLALNFKPLYIQIRKDFAKILPINASEYRVQTCCTDINVTATYFNDLDRLWSVVNEHKKFKKQTIIVKKRKRPVNRRTTAKWNNNFV
uniref:Uncharacterized protein n=1 Tax=Ditylenchus dipsaci TaxID=166011 RepID=A0A915DIY3_9BILA